MRMLEMLDNKLSFLLFTIPFLFLSCNSGSVSKKSKPDSISENIIVDTASAIKLGHQLFFDRRLSINNEIACASCHNPRKAFTDGGEKATGIYGRKTLRNSPSLLNTKYQPHFMLDGGISTLEIQALDPLRDTAEMGNDIKELVFKLRKIDTYNEQSLKAYNRDLDPFVITKSLALFQKTLLSENSSFDKWIHGDSAALSEEAIKGYELFSGKMNCIACHYQPHLTNFELKNNGWHTTYVDHGRFRITGDSTDIGKFKVPSLRNVILTAPYMHDGSAANLDEVLDNYIKGGSSHSNKDHEIKGFDLTEKERLYVMAFFESLTDTSYMETLTPDERAFR